ncbi:MAG: substrate-binding domain-containing protein [Arcicella sp.]|nr:substrate-binding domain-containing protein [Arcicella sp.]
MIKIVNRMLIVLGMAILASCGGGKDKDGNELDTPAKGTITVAVDESFRQILEAEKTAFEKTFPYTKINLVFKPEGEAVAMMLNDKARMAVVARELTEKEKEVFKRDDIRYKSFKFAGDGIALITNKANKDTLITTQELEDVMRGKRKDIVLVFDGTSSSNLTFLVDTFKLDKTQKVSFFAAKSNKEVIEYVQTHKNAMGVIGSNWISDGDDPTSLTFIRSVNVMSVANKPNPTIKDYYQPFGYNLALKKYPLTRKIKLILKEAHMGLGTGFINYMTLEQGQLIVYKNGLIPLTQPLQIRQVESK